MRPLNDSFLLAACVLQTMFQLLVLKGYLLRIRSIHCFSALILPQNQALRGEF